MQVTVHLKAGLRFSDGSPLTADDVLFGLRLNRDPALGNSFGLDEIARATVTSPHTIVLQFGDLYGAYLAYAMPPALPRAYFVRKYHTTNLHALALAYARDPYDSPRDVFSGPYRVAAVAPGQRLTLAPNPYFTALPPARIGGKALPRPELRYVVVSDDETALVRALHVSPAGSGCGAGTRPGLAGGAARARRRPAPAGAARAGRRAPGAEPGHPGAARPARAPGAPGGARQARARPRALPRLAPPRPPGRDQPDPLRLAVPRRAASRPAASISRWRGGCSARPGMPRRCMGQAGAWR